MPVPSGGRLRHQPDRLTADVPQLKHPPPSHPASEPPPARKKSEHGDPPALSGVVWAKVKGFPWWPARVQSVSGQTITVVFFGTEQLGKVRATPSSCVPFSARPTGAVVAAGKRGQSGHDAFVEAVAQAEAHDVRVGLGMHGHAEVECVECTDAVEEFGGELAVEVVAVEDSGEADEATAAAKKSGEGKRRKRSSCPFTTRGKKSKKSKQPGPAIRDAVSPL